MVLKTGLVCIHLGKRTGMREVRVKLVREEGWDGMSTDVDT